MDEQTCCICGEKAPFRPHVEGIGVSLCGKHAVNALLIGPNVLQLDDGTLYRRVGMTDEFKVQGEGSDDRMTDG